MAIKVLEFFEQRLLQKFLDIHEDRIRVLGFSAVHNDKSENPFVDPDRFYIIADIEPPSSDMLISVAGSSSLIRANK